jgi:hypothetical protein
MKTPSSFTAPPKKGAGGVRAGKGKRVIFLLRTEVSRVLVIFVSREFICIEHTIDKRMSNYLLAKNRTRA